MRLFDIFKKKDKFIKVEIQKSIEWDEPNGEGCFASDRITKEGFKVGYMYRETPEEPNDSGWRFFAGTETQEEIDNPNNIGIYDVNTIANYDASIIPYLNAESDTAFEKARCMDAFKRI